MPFMSDSFQIIEKPDWISWEEIKQCLVDSHKINREKGIFMSHYMWSPEQIKSFIGNGVVFVAIHNKRLIGTAALKNKNSKAWYVRGECGYLCFDSVLPEFSGRGIFNLLDNAREERAKLMGCSIILFDTHSKNNRRQAIAKRAGYKYVDFFRAATKDHYSVVMAKWLNIKCRSAFYCWCRFLFAKCKAIVSAFISSCYQL